MELKVFRNVCVCLILIGNQSYLCGGSQMMKTFQKETLNPEIQEIKKCLHGLKDLRMF